MPLPSSIRLKDGRSANIRRARGDDAEAWLQNVNSIGAEQVYIMTERLERTVDQLREQFANAPPSKELWLVAEVEGAIVGGADFKRGSRPRTSTSRRWGLRSPGRSAGLASAST